MPTTGTGVGILQYDCSLRIDAHTDGDGTRRRKRKAKTVKVFGRSMVMVCRTSHIQMATESEAGKEIRRMGKIKSSVRYCIQRLFSIAHVC